MYIYDNGVFKPFLETKLKQLIKNFLDDPVDFNEETQRYSQSLLTQVKNHLHKNLIKLEEFDKEDYRLCCKNGIIDLERGSFMPHWKHDENPPYFFIQIPVEYDPDATCPNILKFITQLVGKERFPLIYEIIGYILYKSIKLQKAFIFFGEPGCGKTTFFDMLKEFIGWSNWTDVNIHTLSQKYELENLRNKMANISDELPLKKLNYIANFKQATTNKILTGAMKYVQGSISWYNICKQLFSCNKLPEVDKETGQDFWRRIILIHCTNVIKKEDRDINILDKITTHKEFSGLLNKCIFHFQKLIKRGKFDDRYDDIDKIEGIWQINVNPIKLFLDECCIITNKEEDYEEKSYFRAQVNAFRKARNAEPISLNMISRKLKDLIISTDAQKADGKRYYIGIKIEKTIIDKIDSIILGGKILDEF